MNLSFTFGHLNIAGWVLFGIVLLKILIIPLVIGKERTQDLTWTWEAWVYALIDFLLILLALRIV